MEQGIEMAPADATARSWLGAGRALGGRPSQQDDLVCLEDEAARTQLLVLADGMGGDGAGELASAGVIAVAQRQWHEGRWRELPGALFLEQLCQEAHRELRRRGAGLVDAAPHATVVALLLKGRMAFWAHVGDSRLYRFERARVLSCTEDHSVVQARVRRGELRADEAGAAVDQHQLLRGLGGPLQPRVDHGCAPLRRGHAFALCSDGVWEHLSARELAGFAGRPDLHAAVGEALALVLGRAGEDGDNAALILVSAARGRRSWLPRPGSWWSALSGAGRRTHSA